MGDAHPGAGAERNVVAVEIRLQIDHENLFGGQQFVGVAGRHDESAAAGGRQRRARQAVGRFRRLAQDFSLEFAPGVAGEADPDVGSVGVGDPAEAERRFGRPEGEGLLDGLARLGRGEIGTVVQEAVGEVRLVPLVGVEAVLRGARSAELAEGGEVRKAAAVLLEERQGRLVQPSGPCAPSGNSRPSARACLRQLYSVASLIPSSADSLGIGRLCGGSIFRRIASLRSFGYLNVLSLRPISAF